jgi:FkbM family methyltransferase
MSRRHNGESRRIEGGMRAIRHFTRSVLERVAGYEVQRLGRRSLAFINVKRSGEVWSSYRSQLRWLLNAHRIDLVIDVGANTGQFARGLRSIYSGDIISFEPVGATFAQLKAAAASDPKWTCHQLALGEKEDTLPIHVTNRSVFSSMLQPNEFSARKFGADASHVSTEMVPVRRLEDVLREAGPSLANRRIFLKLDTQGFDQQVFGGLGAFLSNVHVLQSEVSVVPIYENMPHWTSSILAYEQAGFHVCGMFPVSRDNGRVIEFDCIMARARA